MTNNYSKLQHRTRTASLTAVTVCHVKPSIELVISKGGSPYLNESPQHLALAMVTRRLYCVEWHNAVFARSGPLSERKLFTSCIRRCLASTETEWCQRYLPRYFFQFPIQSAFLPHIDRQAAPALRRTIGFIMQYRTSDVAENLEKNGKLTSVEGQFSVW